MSENIVVNGIEYQKIDTPQLTGEDKKEIWGKLFRWFRYFAALPFAMAVSVSIFVNIKFEAGAAVAITLFIALVLVGIFAVPLWLSAKKKTKLKNCQTCGNEYRTISYDLGNVTEYVSFCDTCGKAFSEKFIKSGSENVNL